MHNQTMSSNIDDIPTWSQDGLAAKDVFFDTYNSVNFYVEDVDQENLYFEILSRLFPDIEITQIFPLGGKISVINHAEDLVNQPQAHRSIYIVDKDFDDLLGKVVRKDNIFYLSKYSIENFLLEESAVIEVAVETLPKISRETHAKKLSFNTFLSDSIEQTSYLFKLFFAVQQLNLGLKNCNHKVEVFSIKNHPESIDREKVKNYQAAVKEMALRKSIFKSDEEFLDFVTNVFPKDITSDVNINGKYLLTLTMHYLNLKLKAGNLSLNSLTYRLARHCNLSELKFLKTNINDFLEKAK